MKLAVLLGSVLLLSISVLSQEDESAAPPVDNPETSAGPHQGGAAEPREPGCDKYEVGSCTKQYEPVCGNDGTTYSTECTLCQNNREKKKNVKVAREGPCPV